MGTEQTSRATCTAASTRRVCVCVCVSETDRKGERGERERGSEGKAGL